MALNITDKFLIRGYFLELFVVIDGKTYHIPDRQKGIEFDVIYIPEYTPLEKFPATYLGEKVVFTGVKDKGLADIYREYFRLLEHKITIEDSIFKEIRNVFKVKK